MVRIKIIFSVDRVTAFEHQEEEKLLPQDKAIDPMPAVPRIGDVIDSSILPIPLQCSYFRGIEWEVGQVEWSKDQTGYYARLYVKP